MKKVKTAIGDIFEVNLDGSSKKYFQYIANDITQLNSDVIRAFKKVFPIEANPDFFEIVTSEVEFYAHCVIKWGIKMEQWKKVGHVPYVGKTEILFRDTNDAARKIGEESVKVSSNWYVWKINEEFRHVGKLEGENRKAEIGLVISPINIVHRMRAGKYSFIYPSF